MKNYSLPVVLATLLFGVLVIYPFAMIFTL